MYGLGYGLGEMVEGATTGLLAQKRYDEAKAAQAAAATETSAYRNRQLDIQERNAATQEQLARISKSSSAMRTAIDALEKTGDKEFAKRMLKILDPELPDDFDFNMTEKDITIDTPEYTIVGPRERVAELLDVIENNPQEASNAISVWARSGVGKIVKKPPKEEKDKYINVALGYQVIDPKTGKVIYTAPEKAGKDKEITMANYGTFISKIFSKYKMGDSGFSLNEDGTIKFDAAKFFGSQQSAYDVIKEKAKTDPEAKQDLEDLQAAYTKMKEMLFSGRPAAAPATPGTLGGMVSGQTGPAAGFENMPFQPGVTQGSMANMPSAAGKDAEMTKLKVPKRLPGETIEQYLIRINR